MSRTFQIAVVGPECSGKTTLANELGNRLNAPVVPEVARGYLSEIGKEYSKVDVDEIASLQSQSAENVSSSKLELVVHDTEILTIKIWQEEKWNKASQVVEKLWQEQFMDYYLLCSPDLPWVDDGLRENPEDRHRLFKIYEQQLMKARANYTVISGKGAERLNSALVAIGKMAT